MRVILSGLGVLVLAIACGPAAKTRAASDAVVANAADPGVAWPLLLQHCLRAPHCDPASNFGKGEGEASGLVESVDWFVQTKDAVKEGGEDYGASLALSAYGARGVGGEDGRPLTIDELPDSLAGANARRSRLSIEYRTPGGGAPTPYGLVFQSAWLQFPSTPPDEAKIEISGQAGVLLSEAAGAMEAEPAGAKATPRAIDPILLFYPRNLRDEPLQSLLAALMAGETLSLKVTDLATGRLVLQDGIYGFGFDGALGQASAALHDAEIVKPIEERCGQFAANKDAFWKLADVTPALLVCDPRTPEQRR
jgi:hypothetical protein